MKGTCYYLTLPIVALLLHSCAMNSYTGVYEYNDQVVSYKKLALNKDGTFSYYSSHSTGSTVVNVGQGKYVIEEDSIMLDFVGVPEDLNQQSILHFYKKDPRDTDVASMSIQANLDDGNSASGASIYDENLRPLTALDEEGSLNMGILRGELPATYYVIRPGYQPVRLRLDDPRKDYTIKAELRPVTNNTYWKMKQEKYPIAKVGKKIAIKDLNVVKTKPLLDK